MSESVMVKPCKDAEGMPDWLMLYTPGPKARTEFLTFNGSIADAKPDPAASDTIEPEQDRIGVSDSCSACSSIAAWARHGPGSCYWA